MNHFLLNVGSLLKNPHLRYPTLAVVVIEIAKVWLPTYETQLNSTQKIIMVYLVAVAANSTPTQVDNSPLTKPPTDTSVKS